MTPFRDTPIRRKLLILTLASSATALVLAGAGFLAWDFYTLRSEIEGDLATKTRLLAENTSASLEFNDRREARTLLASLKEVAHINVACLYGIDGRALFAEFEPSRDRCPRTLPETATSEARTLESTRRVEFRDKHVGWLMLRRDLDDLFAVHEPDPGRRMQREETLMIGIQIV